MSNKTLIVALLFLLGTHPLCAEKPHKNCDPASERILSILKEDGLIELEDKNGCPALHQLQSITAKGQEMLAQHGYKTILPFFIEKFGDPDIVKDPEKVALKLLILNLAPPYRGSGPLPSIYNPDTLKAHITGKQSEINYSEIFKNNRVALFGEMHANLAIKKELASHMPEIKKAGVTHLGLEMLPDTAQELLSRYLETGKGREELAETLQKEWGWTTHAYMDVIDAARNQGIKVIALDMPVPQQKEHEDKIKSVDEFGASRVLHLRDRHMADNIAETLKSNPESKMLVLAGRGHVGRSAIPDVMLKKHGLSPPGYMTVSKSLDEPDIYQRAVEALGLSSGRFLVGLPIETPYAGFIHLPPSEPSAEELAFAAGRELLSSVIQPHPTKYFTETLLVHRKLSPYKDEPIRKLSLTTSATPNAIAMQKDKKRYLFSNEDTWTKLPSLRIYYVEDNRYKYRDMTPQEIEEFKKEIQIYLQALPQDNEMQGLFAKFIKLTPPNRSP